MSRVEVRVARPGDAAMVAGAMRAADVRELWRVAHYTPAHATEAALQVSDEAWCGTVDGVPACLFGLAWGPGFRVPWLLGTDAVAANGRAFLRLNRPVVARWRAAWPSLRNMVDAENAVAIRWLEWLGARIGAPEPWGVERAPFRPFELGTGLPDGGKPWMRGPRDV